MKKELSLNEIWKLSLSQWKWVTEQIQAGSQKNSSVLKMRWMEDHNYNSIFASCFFCDYKSGYHKCPGKLVDENFLCFNPSYHYEQKPFAFYNEMKRLNKKRKESLE